MNNAPRMLRKRYIPDELVDISGDEVLYRDKNILITRWKTIRPRPDFDWGVSFVFLNDGYKVSRFYDKSNIFLYWYCDIIEVEYNESKDMFLFKDLLLDVKIMPDGKAKLLDADEMADAVTRSIITKEQISKALLGLAKLYDQINNGKFPHPICLEPRYINPATKQEGVSPGERPSFFTRASTITVSEDTSANAPTIMKAVPAEKVEGKKENPVAAAAKTLFSREVGETRKIKVMVVDDSVFFNKILTDGISSDPEIEVIETAFDAYEADRKLGTCKPDVITLDIEMPGLNGLEFLKRLMVKRPIPVIVVSSANQYVFEALNAGAIEFIDKPKSMIVGDVDLFSQELIAKIKIASKAKIALEGYDMKKNYFDATPKYTKDTIIAIGASTGGTDATYKILTTLPADMPPIIIAQHMPASFTKMYAERLNRFSRLEVIEAYDGAIATAGKVLIAPGDFHMKLVKSGSNYVISCNKDDKVNGHRPSVDVLFESVSIAAGRYAYGVILTGMGGDGAKGLLKMRQAGARTIGQDEATSVVYGMPRVAYDIGAVEKQVAIDKVVATLIDYLK